MFNLYETDIDYNIMNSNNTFTNNARNVYENPVNFINQFYIPLLFWYFYWLNAV